MIITIVIESEKEVSQSNNLLTMVKKATNQYTLRDKKTEVEKQLTDKMFEELVKDINAKYNEVNILARFVINSIWVHILDPNSSENGSAYNIALDISVTGYFSVDDDFKIICEPKIYINKKGGFSPTNIVMEDFYELFNLEFASREANVQKMNRINRLV